MRTALTIAGSDPGGGAGIQADLKTFAAHGVYGLTAITALTVQNTLGVTAVSAVEARLVAAQIDAVVSDFGADATKIGMLATAALVEAAADAVRRHRLAHVVLDPVFRATSGQTLLDEAAIDEAMWAPTSTVDDVETALERLKKAISVVSANALITPPPSRLRSLLTIRWTFCGSPSPSCVLASSSSARSLVSRKALADSPTLAAFSA
jgi:hydroxymethylpyrimidine/phosphomethylpyrimidine kinase